MATTITVISSMATRLVLVELARKYESETGAHVEVKAMGGVPAANQVREGEAFDVVVLASGVMAKLEAEGHIVAGSVQGVTRSAMAIAIRAGAARPDISNETAVRRAVLAAGKIGYSTGPSGDYMLKLYERWGLPADRLVLAPPGVPVGSLVSEGHVDIGVQQLIELIHVPGIEVLGPLPPDLQSMTVFAAGVASASEQPDAAQALIAYLTSPDTEAVKREQGMEPA